MQSLMALPRHLVTVPPNFSSRDPTLNAKVSRLFPTTRYRALVRRAS